MTQVKQTLSAAVIVAPFLFICVEAIAQEKPPVPNTGIQVTDIDNDWVELSITHNFAVTHDLRDLRNMTITVADEMKNKIFSQPDYGNEVMDTASFACGLYKRVAVYLSMGYDTRQTKIGVLVDRIYFLFACAIPAGQ